jgi:Flp pilus assembly protein TadD
MGATMPTLARVAAVIVLACSGCASLEGARLYRSGTQALDRGEPARAIADLERAAQLVPQASEVQNHLGLAYAAEGREADATRAFRRAVELDCDNAAAQQNLRAAESRSARAAP